MAGMLGRNFHFFAKTKIQIRAELEKQLKQYKAAVEDSTTPKPNTSAYEEFLEKNTLVNRLIMVGMDMPHVFFRTIPHGQNLPLCRVRVLDRYNPYVQNP